MNNDIFTEKELETLKSMKHYWDEVEKREDISPLVSEARYVNNLIGIRVLDLVRFYLKELDK